MGKVTCSTTTKTMVEQGGAVERKNMLHHHPFIGGGGGGAVEQPTTIEVEQKLAEIARRVQRLAPSHRNPHRFHEDKSEIVAELHRLASEVHHG